MNFLLTIFLSIALNQPDVNEQKIVIILNDNNNCLVCNISISQLFEKIDERKINTVVYLNGLNRVQIKKINSDLDIDLETTFKIINQKEKYNSLIKNHPQISPINSYLILYNKDKLVKLYDLVELVKNNKELAGFFKLLN